MEFINYACGESNRIFAHKGQQLSASTPAPQGDESPTTTSKKTGDQRKELLSRAVANRLAQGKWRVESQSDYSAVLIKGKGVNHTIHVILDVVTLGFWLFVHIPVWLINREQRTMVSVDEYGNTNWEEL